VYLGKLVFTLVEATCPIYGFCEKLYCVYLWFCSERLIIFLSITR